MAITAGAGVTVTSRGGTDQIESLCRQAIRERVFPGCVVGFIRSDKSAVLPFGSLTYEKDAPRATPRTVYDVASVTKSIPTGCIILKLIEDRRLSLKDKAVDFVPELKNEYRGLITIWHLLTYTVVFDLPDGLAAASKRAPDRVVEAIMEAPLMAAPGEKYYYTNSPAVILGLIAERVCNQPLDQIAQEMFFDGLSMDRTTFHPSFPRDEIAPSEHDWRGEVRSMPHDEAAWAMREHGQIAGNAALFSTAGDLLRFAQMLLNEGELDGRRYFAPETVRQMHTNQILELGASTGLGWELNWPIVMGSKGSDQIFGKTGFTGCVIIMDPVKQRALVHLSNRTYPKRPESRDPINAFRRALADIVLGD